MKKLTFILLLLTYINLYSSEEHHDNNGIHIGLGTSGFYMSEDDEIYFGLHTHFVKNIYKSLGIGVGYEAIFAHEYHQTIDCFLNLEIFDKFVMNLGPSLVIHSDEDDWYKLGGHLEMVYEFDFEYIHIGPMIGFGLDEHDSHVSFGIHLGYGF